ncbi:tRNA (adenosine(37)-N6)-threonylcarbamoyltransferase complex dimerization subunit type 1 TsaB [Paenibacillus sp. MMS18-CY102]|uniref:tRNA (adenosine(37)-N6)-threonylcarbamoyltransferase complex dimerization subunit type 1 TsaB n=1 Tax=Paenibacillus sp. MMS18-CY102 TaxID=2682849 RepID=UPI0013658B22|nr:tRNA (adenosine(37)-N6)-threonylcarbamoyltransferase complex dimerization subunit type 1 TsaB [Paenibacillus sp. MMS18-CY102]MWC30391.1 tRNA (adenosine(37)-N6)-threonylcarbamoyltransferase complex dimerization subunit type 1 TsaB [Paenibacillus sp. MMS18-CY102]
MSGTTGQASAAQQPIVLALDTSTATMAMAIVQGNEVLGEVHSLAERNHSVEVVSKIKGLLASRELTQQELGGIAVGRGPGSYTGMRIGVTVAKTLAWAWRLPLVGVSSLEALAFGQMNGKCSGTIGADADAGLAHEQWFVPIMDARRGQVYTAAFISNGDVAWQRMADDGIRLMNGWADQLYALASEHRSAEPSSLSIMIGGDVQIHEAELVRLSELCAGIGVQVDYANALMEGRSVALLGAARIAGGEHEEVHTFVPNYTQLTEAEVKLREKQQAERESQ